MPRRNSSKTAQETARRAIRAGGERVYDPTGDAPSESAKPGQRYPANVSHTPGPWVVDALGIGTPWSVGTETQDIGLASQLVGDPIITDDGRRQPRRTANAHLMAAAPDMLDALRLLLKAYESLLPGIKYLALQDYAIINDAPIAAERAIRKATEIAKVKR